MKPHLSKTKITFCFCSISLCVLLLFGYSQGQETKYPSRPITNFMPFPAGNSSDLAVRLISKEAEKFLGQPITVVNKPGGSGTIGAAALATAKPDGYTIGHLGSSGLFIVPYLENVPYHPVRDFTFIMQFGAFNMGIIVKADSPFKSFKDLMNYARQNPKKVTFGTNGVNSVQHILMEQICKKENLEMTHIPFKGGSEVETALLGGHVLCGVGDFNYSLVEAGLTRFVLILRQERSAEYPEVPCVKDVGFDFWEPAVLNVSGPKGMDEGMVKKIADAFTKAMKEPGFIDGMKNINMPVFFRNGKDLTNYVTYNYELWGKFLKERGLTK
jgi:tripartite-type tricarboxylate transporter receptor subunit TctC